MAQPRRSRLRGFRARSDTQAPLARDYTICDFQSGTKFVFSLHDSRIRLSYQNKSFIRNENRDELILERLVLERNVVSVSRKQTRRNI